MNPFYNPLFLFKTLKSYFFDIDRLNRFNEEKLRSYQDAQLRKMMKHAFQTSFYRDKYKKADVKPGDIKTVDDIKKLPLITKNEIIKNPEGITPRGVNNQGLIKITSSATTGRSVTFYTGVFEFILWFFWYIRILRDYDISWRREKLTVIADFAPGTVASGYVKKSLNRYLKNKRFFSNIQWLNSQYSSRFSPLNANTGVPPAAIAAAA